MFCWAHNDPSTGDLEHCSREPRAIRSYNTSYYTFTYKLTSFASLRAADIHILVSLRKVAQAERTIQQQQQQQRQKQQHQKAE